jgi:hypothetical protein
MTHIKQWNLAGSLFQSAKTLQDRKWFSILGLNLDSV